jgi:hypothetical protein
MHLIGLPTPFAQISAPGIGKGFAFTLLWQPGLEMAAAHFGCEALESIESSTFGHHTS